MIKRLLYLLAITSSLYGQNETNVWYFGINAGLNFSTTPPSVLTNGVLFTSEGCSSMSDALGNLLFYSDGDTVFTRTHLIMANGAGLTGHHSTSQSALIIKQPGNTNLYYVFTQDAQAGANGFRYSIVDMNLAAGMGSVTVKNIPLYTPSTEKIAATRHCNGSDVWVLSHDFNSNTFRALLLTSTGLNSTPILSSVGSTLTGININTLGCMKFSPNGKKLAMGAYASFELFDFDPSTGIVSNPIYLTGALNAYGCEFSSDGTKLYTSSLQMYRIWQWDMCAGSNTAIVASQFTIATTQAPVGNIQRGPDGKIYGARFYKTDLCVINNPNASGAACNFVETGLSIAPKISLYGLPGFLSNIKPLIPFTYSVSCQTGSFTAPPTPTTTSGCAASNNTLTNRVWFFGDPASGTANTSSLSNPTHSYSAAGTYTVKLVNYYQCASDTVQAIVSIAASPILSVSGTYTICKGDKRTYTASGASTYGWSGSTVNTSSISLAPITTTVISVTGTNTLGCTSSKAFTITVNNCSVLKEEQGAGVPIKVYPTESSGIYFLEVEESTQIYIYDQRGTLVLFKEFEKGKHEIDLRSFDNGIYLVKPVDRNLRSTRIIKTDL